MHSSTPALQMWHNIFIKFDRPPIFKSVQLRVMSQHRSRYGFYFVSFKYEKKAKKKKKQMKREREREREGRPVRNCCQLAKILLRSLIKCCGKNSEAMNSIFFSLALFLCFSLSLFYLYSEDVALVFVLVLRKFELVTQSDWSAEGSNDCSFVYV